jgi:hypothetical protein
MCIGGPETEEPEMLALDVHCATEVGSRGSRFLDFFWIFSFLQFAIDGKNNSKTKVEKVVFLYFHVFLCGNEFFKIKNHKIGSKIFVWK